MSVSKYKIGVIQLTRIGDLIQTMQAARQLKAENDNLEITLIARRSFGAGIEFLLKTVFDEIIFFDTKDFFTKKTLKDGVNSVHNFVYDINKIEFDLLFNLSFSKSSSYLASLVQSKFKMGVQRNTLGEIVLNDKWSQYIFSNVMNGTNTPFSLVDLYKYIMGVKETHYLTPEEDETYLNDSIVLHPFASTKKKRWGLNKWTELIHKLAKENPSYFIHIVGGPEDEQDSSRIKGSPSLEKYQEQLVFHAGKKSIIETFGLLQNSRLFIGHDSMVSHLASETTTPSIIVSLGEVKPSETNPYQANVINISPKNKCFPCQAAESCELLPCHNSLSHQVISTIASGILNKEEIDTEFLNSKINSFHMDSIRITKSSFSNNGLELTEISENYCSAKDAFKAFYNIIWQYYFRGADVTAPLPHISRETAIQLSPYIEGSSYLYDLYNFGVKYSNKIIAESETTNPNLALIQENINKLNEIDKLCTVTKKNFPLLADMVDYFYVNKANPLGDKIIDIAKHNLLSFYDGSNLIAAIQDFVEKSVEPHLPKPTQNKEV